MQQQKNTKKRSKKGAKTFLHRSSILVFRIKNKEIAKFNKSKLSLHKKSSIIVFVKRFKN